MQEEDMAYILFSLLTRIKPTLELIIFLSILNKAIKEISLDKL